MVQSRPEIAGKRPLPTTGPGSRPLEKAVPPPGVQKSQVTVTCARARSLRFRRPLVARLALAGRWLGENIGKPITWGAGPRGSFGAQVQRENAGYSLLSMQARIA